MPVWRLPWKGRDAMKKYIYALMLLLLCTGCAGSRRAEAYSVTVQKDGMYAGVIPDSFVNNAAAIFKRHVKKAMKYYGEYKDVDNYAYDYNYVANVPEEYRDFIPVAKQIQDSDEIIIRNPFYIYHIGDSIEDGVWEYYFFAEKNGEKLCLFSIVVDGKKTAFSYEKMMDKYFIYDERTMGKALFYAVDDKVYAETPDKVSVARDQRGAFEIHEMISDNAVDWKSMEQEFKEKSYREKKNEIFGYLKKVKKGKAVKKSEKNLKVELKEEYVEPEEEYIQPEAEAQEERPEKVTPFIILAAAAIGMAAGTVFVKRRRKE